MQILEPNLLRLLEAVPDPEIPVVNIVELGIVRRAELRGSEVTVTITPTYSGCPAMREIERSIQETLNLAGFPDVHVETVHSPPWTTDWLSEETKEKLRAYGIAAPKGGNEDQLVTLGRSTPPCPYCGAAKTELRSEFGATACKSFYYCNSCLQPFEYFKSI